MPQTFTERTPEAYERLLLDVIRGNQTLFMRRDELEAAWNWVDPIREAWDAATDAPQSYTAGTWGPTRRHRADRARRPHLVRGRRLMPERARSFADQGRAGRRRWPMPLPTT